MTNQNLAVEKIGTSERSCNVCRWVSLFVCTAISITRLFRLWWETGMAASVTMSGLVANSPLKNAGYCTDPLTWRTTQSGAHRSQLRYTAQVSLERCQRCDETFYGVWSHFMHFMPRSNSAIDEVFSRLAESVVSRVVNLACCETVWNAQNWSK